MRIIICFSVLSIIFTACIDETSIPIVPDGQNNLVFSNVTDTIDVFPHGYKNFKILILEGTIDPMTLEMQNFEYDNFEIYGPWIADSTNKVLSFHVYGLNVSSKTESVILPLKINDVIYNISLSVYVSELYLIDRYDTNAPNDTITIYEGANFLLNISCIDTAGNVTPKSVIEPLGFGFGYGHWQNHDHLKFVVTSVNIDSIHYSFMFSAFSDISPDLDDRNLNFSFTIDGKGLWLPVKIIYD
jgi:hypothetical protein